MRPDHRAWAAWFFGLILIGVVLALSGVQPNSIDDATDAEAPGWEVSRLLDDEYYREIDAWALDNGSLEGVGRWARYQVDYGLFNDTTSPDVLVGSDGWLFDRTTTDLDCALIDGIEPFDASGAPPGSLQQFVTLPKAFWLTTRIAADDQPAACTVGARRELVDRFAAAGAGNGGSSGAALDPTTVIATEAEANFARTTPFWSSAGEIAAARAIVEFSAPGAWDDEAIVAATRSEVPALRQMLGNNTAVNVPTSTVERPMVTVEQLAVEEVDGLLVYSLTRATTNGNDQGGNDQGGNDENDTPAIAMVPGVTHIVGDEQTIRILPLLTPYFEELVFYNWTQLDLILVGVNLLPPPDRVLLEGTEQTFIEYGNDPRVTQLIGTIRTGAEPSPGG